MTSPGLRFWVLLGPLWLALCAGYAAAVLYGATWQEARALNAIFPFYGRPIRAFSAADWEFMRQALAGAAGSLAGLFFIQLLTRPGCLELAALGREVQLAASKLTGSFHTLPVKQRLGVAATLLFITALRLYFSLANPAYDDAISYVVFVSEGWLATSAYYPIPNNHVLSNTLSLLFYQAHHGFWWSMRLPVLLVCTASTGLLWAGLRRLAGVRVALLATALVSVLELSLYHAGAGRGYWLFTGLAIVVFFSTLVLSGDAGGRRAAWAALLVAGTLGCFTIPTFVLVLASAYSWLGLTYGRRRAYRPLLQAALAGVCTGLAALALYAPLLFVSGFEKLAGNGFVASLAATKFWRGLPTYVWFTEGFLAGQRTVGALLTGLTLAGIAWLLRQQRLHRLPDAPTPTALTRPLLRLAPVCVWFMALPYALIVARRVFPPERVLLYKAVFFFILVALVVEWTLSRWPAAKSRWLRPALAALAVGFTAYQAVSIVRVSPIVRYRNEQFESAARWLAAQPPGPVLVPETAPHLLLRLYALSDYKQAWELDYRPQPQTSYAYVVAYRRGRGSFRPQFAFPPAYHNETLEIYAVPPGYPPDASRWLPEPAPNVKAAGRP